MPIVQPEEYRRYRRYFTGLGALYKKKQVKVYTGIVLSLLTVAFFAFFAIRPTLVTISGLLKEIKDKQKLVEQMDQKINNLASAQSNYAQIASKLPLVEESLPQEPTLPVLMKQLEALTRISSVNLESLSFNEINLQGEPGEKKFQEISFQLSLSGNYQNLKQFLNSLDNLRRIILVDSFAFKSQTKEGAQYITLTVSAKAHYLIRNP